MAITRPKNFSPWRTRENLPEEWETMQDVSRGTRIQLTDVPRETIDTHQGAGFWPASSTRRRDLGIGTGPVQFHSLTRNIFSASWAPSHRTICPAGEREPLTHSSSCGSLPTALAAMKSA